MTISAPF
jgi:hypothetical protein